MKILISGGAFITRANQMNYRLMKEIVPTLDCDGIEFMMSRGWYDNVDDLIECLKELDTYIPIMHFDKNLGENLVIEGIENVIDKFETNCRIAKSIGAKKAVLHLWDGQTSDQHIEKNIEAYRVFRKIADQYGIELLVENVVCNKYNPFCNWNWLIEKYPDISYIFDTKMAAFHSQLDGLYEFDKIDHIKHYHVNDYAGGYMDWGSLLSGTVPVGKGNIDFSRFFNFLKKIGYDGTITLEAPFINKETGEVDYNILNGQLKIIRELSA
ncbi:MAG: sugar phosphate isomerase/epimerase [Lachnospiraceae bacterium]|nr:sugar phosphate isomerase/epimerase [Lachnospiraceae bacterium]